MIVDVTSEVMKKSLIPVLFLFVCSCVKDYKRPAVLPSGGAARPESLDKQKSRPDLPEYVELNGRIYPIRSMGKSVLTGGCCEKKDYSKCDKTVTSAEREITLIESEKVPEHVVNFARSNITPISEFDRVAMQMVGKYVPDSFRYDRVYYGYMKFFEREWARLERNSLGHVQVWAFNNIIPKLPSVSDTLFYPFGGPDIAYALAFYPEASEYVLIGLEPIGRFKDIRAAVQDPVNFEQVKLSLSTYLRGGYFVTSEMGKSLWSKWLQGAMYLILLQLAACDFEVSNVEEIGVDKYGNEISRNGSDSILYCVRITCRKRGKQRWQHVYYVRADLANSNRKLENLFNFMNKRRFNTMFKSASYAIWDRTLTKIRNFILKNSRSVLQDDTGIPFDCYKREWNKYAFGSYTEPTLEVFKKVYRQPNMAEFFQKYAITEIPFKIGYGFYQSRPNLLLAVPKKGEQGSAERSFKKTFSQVANKKRIVGEEVDKNSTTRQVKESKDFKVGYEKDEQREGYEEKKEDPKNSESLYQPIEDVSLKKIEDSATKGSGKIEKTAVDDLPKGHKSLSKIEENDPKDERRSVETELSQGDIPSGKQQIEIKKLRQPGGFQDESSEFLKVEDLQKRLEQIN